MSDSTYLEQGKLDWSPTEKLIAISNGTDTIVITREGETSLHLDNLSLPKGLLTEFSYKIKGGIENRDLNQTIDAVKLSIEQWFNLI